MSPDVPLRPLRTWRRRRETLEVMRSIDAEEQSALQPPSEELIQTRFVIVADAFAPSDSPSLIRGVRKSNLGDTVFGHGDPAKAITSRRKSTRPHPTGQLGILVPHRQTPNLFPGVTQTDLPEGVRYAIPSHTSFGGSLTIISCAFLLDANAGRAVDRTARRAHPSIPVPDGRGYWGPEGSQQDALRRTKQEQRDELGAWFTDRFHGTFARLRAPLPAAQLQTHRTAAAESGGFDLARLWPHTLDVTAGFDVWRSTKWPALLMSLGQRDQRSENCLVLSARESALLPRRSSSHPPRSLDEEEGWYQLGQQLSKSLGGTMALWTELCLLTAYSGRLAEFRDTLTPAGVQARTASKRLAVIARQAREVADMRAVTRDLTTVPDAWIYKAWDGNEWAPVYKKHRVSATNRFVADNAGYVSERAKDMLEREDVLMERLGLEISLFAGAGGLRAQRAAVWIAIVALLVAVAALAVAIKQ